MRSYANIADELEPAGYSADYYLEQKISWWWRLAELRRPAPPLAAAATPADTPASQPQAV